MTELFYTAGAVALSGAALAVTGRHAIHALLCLLVALLGLALAVFALGAPYAAILLVIIYAGAIMMLFLIVVMMLGFNREAEQLERERQPWTAWIAPSLLGLVLLGEWMLVILRTPPARAGQIPVAPNMVGIALFRDYVLGVELASMLLLAGLIGAYHLVRRDEGGPRARAAEPLPPEPQATEGESA